MNERDVRLVLCEACGSEGRILRSNGGPDDTDYGPCSACEGTGLELVEVEPVTEAEAMCADADAAHELRALGINCVDPFDTREIDCGRCDGSGQASYSHPNDPSPRTFRCDECDGTGKVNVRVYAIEEEDLP